MKEKLCQVITEEGGNEDGRNGVVAWLWCANNEEVGRYRYKNSHHRCTAVPRQHWWGGGIRNPTMVTTQVALPSVMEWSSAVCRVLGPLFLNFFTKVILHAVRNPDLDIYIRYRLNGSLFDLHCLSARTKPLEMLVPQALLAEWDDCVSSWHTRKVIPRPLWIASTKHPDCLAWPSA